MASLGLAISDLRSPPPGSSVKSMHSSLPSSLPEKGHPCPAQSLAKFGLNILGFPIGLYYAAIIKTRCPPASEFHPVPGSRENSETRMSPAERDDGRQAPGVLHHVMGRGIERKRLFTDKRDRQNFNTRLAALAFEKLCTFCTSP